MNSQAAPKSLPPKLIRESKARRGGLRRWLILGLSVIVVSLAVGRCSAGDGSGGDARAPRMSLQPSDLAAAHPSGERREADFRAVAPPVDIHNVEGAARAASMGQIELPASRSLNSWRDELSGEQISDAVLVFDDPQAAAGIDAMAAPLLSKAFQLISEPLALEGVEDGRLWSASAYAAVSFRIGGVLTFVGSDRADDPDHLLRLAEAARDRIIEANRLATESAKTATLNAASSD
jgi:hypothetical protein